MLNLPNISVQRNAMFADPRGWVEYHRWATPFGTSYSFVFSKVVLIVEWRVTR